MVPTLLMTLILLTHLYLTNFQHHNANTVENAVNYKYQSTKRRNFVQNYYRDIVIYSNGITKLLFFKDWLENLTLFTKRIFFFLPDSSIIFLQHRETYKYPFTSIYFTLYILTVHFWWWWGRAGVHIFLFS